MNRIFRVVMTSVLGLMLVSKVASAKDVFFAADGEKYLINEYFTDSSTLVRADDSIFDYLIKNDSDQWSSQYACFGSSRSNMTLTIGYVAYNNGSTDMDKIRNYTLDQINYIESVNGVMTGYIYTDTRNMYKQLKISWDVGNEHHYACITTGNNPVFLGYFDLKYYDGDYVDDMIAKMNNSLVAVARGQ